jgi:hypothetical protein
MMESSLPVHDPAAAYVDHLTRDVPAPSDAKNRAVSAITEASVSVAKRLDHRHRDSRQGWLEGIPSTSMRSRWVSTVLASGVLALLFACLPASSGAVSAPCGAAGESHPRVLVSYCQEGGIGAPLPSLIISKGRKATVTRGGCTAKFALRRRAWKGLRAALKRADLPTIAGDYPPPNGAADMIIDVITAGRSTVRIAPAAEPRYEEVMRALKPLLRVLDRTVSAGERRIATSCKRNR